MSMIAGGSRDLGSHDSPTVDQTTPEAVSLGSNASRLQVFLDNKLAVTGVVIIVVMFAFCFLGPLVYHTNQVATNIAASNLPPSRRHLLGTDNAGYDILGRLMAGGQASLVIALSVAIVATSLGAVWGATAAYIGGIADTVMMRVVDSLLAIPALFLLLFLSSIITPSIGVMIVVISAVSWLVPARLVRAEVLSLRTREFVEASRVVGASPISILARHLIPNVLGTVVVNATFQVADAVLLIAYLSYLGLGLPPPAANWGGMLSNGVNYVFAGYWWEIWPAGVCIVAVVVAFNFVGDGLRDAVEARLGRR